MINGLSRKALIISLIRKMKKKDSWTGETHIQKCTYFFENLLMVPLEYNFILYKHGPFSFELRDELSSMLADNFIEMEPRRPYGASFLPGKYANVLEKEYSKIIDKYDVHTYYIVDKLANKSVKDLERIATALYVKINKDLADDEIVNQITAIKPHITKQSAREAVDELNNFIVQANEKNIIC